MEQEHTLGQHSQASMIITCGRCCAWHIINQKNPFDVPEYRCHGLAGPGLRTGLLGGRKIQVYSLYGFQLGLRVPVTDPGRIPCNQMGEKVAFL